jgi:tyrosinase-like protein
MPLDRRLFLRQAVIVGPFALSLWLDRDSAWAAECGLPAVGPDCTLPPPPTATQFVPSETKIRTRFSAAELNDPARASQLQLLRDAICKVRDLPPDNVISWTKFIAQHCIHCARSYPTNIHYDWQFLPWHRGILYFLERVMRKLQVNDNVSLCYWDWENSASRTLPAIYAPTNQPLYWANRNLTGPSWPLRDTDVDVQPLLAIPNFTQFGGSSVQRSPVPATYSGPHANVHNAFSPGDMGNLQYSPRDPVFYAHHGNIDRLWSSWVAAGHMNPDFGTSAVYFYDENKVWRYVLLNDLRDERRLGYQYSSLMRPRLRADALERFSVQRSNNVLTLESPLMTKLADTDPEYLLLTNIRNLETFPEDTRRYGVFAAAVESGTDAPKTASFLGMVSRVLSEGHAHAEPLSASLDVSGKLASLVALESSKQSLGLWVAPLDASLKTTAGPIPLVADEISIVG